MKRILLLFISLICIALSSSCAIQDIDDPKDIDYDAYSFAKETMLEVLRCFDEEDSEALKSLFSEELASTSNIDMQIEDAMEYYEGRCVSHGEVHEEEGSGSFQEDHYTYRRIIIKMKDIITDKEKKYRIVFYYTLVDEDSAQIGLHHLRFLNNEGVPVIAIDPDGGRNKTKEDTTIE